MTARKAKTNEKGVLDAEIKRLMTPEAIKELNGLTPTIQQFLLRWQDKRDMILSEELKKELKDFLYNIYIQDNEEMCKNVSEIVNAQNRLIFDAISNQNEILAQIASNIKIIQQDILLIKNRLEKVEGQINDEEKRITKLEKTQRWWNIGLRILIAVLISLIITLYFHYRVPKPLIKQPVKTEIGR